MADIWIRPDGRTGRITLQRPEALNALTYDMCLQIAAALDEWESDSRVDIVLIDGDGPRAFSAGGDIVEMYETGTAGDYTYGRQFWRDEYRMNRRLARFPKPVVSFLHGYTMGGGVGAGCHASHRVVGESSRIAMPECGIGLVPDVGGSHLLAQAPGALGEYLGATGTRMGPGDAIYAGFADLFVPEVSWDQLKTALTVTGDPATLERAREEAPDAPLALQQQEIDATFARGSAADIAGLLEVRDTTFSQQALKHLSKGSPLSVSVAVELIRQARDAGTLEDALALEYRYTFRAMEHGDFLEGIRAQVIDKDQSPNWRHASLRDVTAEEVAAMLGPLGEDGVLFETEPPKEEPA